ncbi:programmed cell death 6-interacting protein-like [Amphibalanus amphitrite]|uniref:programmed cell death 6-interacting protein-like n=1 Tax=Amphibalanus amphitrite TaxID=1232801 RepID=UPI001C914688|nr:programmed cell death 6-interacting protein-like [Amphibalanus amphitrite]
MRARQACLLLALVGAATCQVTDRPTTTTTPVPILKQVNRVNDDGSYTYGYEAADGSFKLETRSANGEVTGKYGYVDSDGVQRVFDYNASKGAGFAPSSELIPSPPPGLPLTSTSQVAPGTFVGDIDVALDGYSEDLDEDGFVDPIPTELLQGRPQTRRPAPQPAARPAPRPAAPARAAAPARQAAPAPAPASSGLPAGTLRFDGAAPQLLPQPQPQPQQFAARLPQQPQFAPQQRFVPQGAPQFAQQPQQFAQRPPQFPPPQQFAQQARQLPQQPQQPFFNVQGFDANNGVIRGFRAN